MNENVNNEPVIYEKEDIQQEFDDKHNSILLSYFNNAFETDINAVVKEMGLSEEDTKYIKSQYSGKPNLLKGQKYTKKQKNQKKKKWNVGDLCCALYDEDLLLYEAVIEKIENNIATIRFIGYGNKQKVPIDLLERSNGLQAIEEQKERAKNSESDAPLEEGDYCRIFNERKSKLEEAVIQEIHTDTQTVVVTTIGYEEPLTGTVNELMNSGGTESRQKQTDDAKISKNIQSASKNDAKNIPTKFVPPPPQMPPPSSELLLQPDNEEEAFACMMSSCYLSGYYAGYYTSLKKMKNQ